MLSLEDAFDSEVAENQTSKNWPIAIEPPHIDRRIAILISTNQSAPRLAFYRREQKVE